MLVAIVVVVVVVVEIADGVQRRPGRAHCTA